MKIHAYRENDWQTLFRLYNECYVADRVSEKFFLEHLIMEPNFDAGGVFIAEENGVETGAVAAQIITRNLSPWSDQVAKARGTGYMMPLICFTPEVGKALIAEAEKYFSEHGIVQVQAAAAGAYLFPDGIDEETNPLLGKILSECGYKQAGHHYSMRCDLHKWRISDAVAEKIRAGENAGITAKVCGLSDLPALRRFLTSGDLIARMQNVAQKLSRNELDEIVIIRSADEVLGYCQYNYYGEPDRVGPFGIAKGHRGQGLGQIMVTKLLETMARRGFRSAWFASCTEANTHFYSKNGFERFRIKYLFTKQLERSGS